jgi:hypothetical protein
MRRKLIFVILLAMILAPLAAFAAAGDEGGPSVSVVTKAIVEDGVATYGEVTVTGTGFASKELVTLLGGYNVEPKLSPMPDYAGQVTTDSDGAFTVVISTYAVISGGNTYYVQASAASLGGAKLFTSEIEASYASIDAPVRYTGKLKATETIPVYVNSKDFEIKSSNTNVLTVAPKTNDVGELIGIICEFKRAGTAYVSIATPTFDDSQLAKSIQVTVK